MKSSLEPKEWRYIRINSFNEPELKELSEKVILPFPSTFYAIPKTENIKNNPEYIAGKLYAMDIASGISASVLNPEAGERVCDLCCSPGNKTMMLADLMQRTGVLHGIDIHPERLSLTGKILCKYRIDECRPEQDWRCCLFLGDGCTFPGTNQESDFGNRLPALNSETKHQLLWDSEAFKFRSKMGKPRLVDGKSIRNCIRGHVRSLKRQNDEISMLRSNVEAPPAKRPYAPALYDKVLVDAQCGGDGSTSHTNKPKSTAFTEAIEEDSMKKAELIALQRRLIENGYNLLKTGGHMVYSTCSMDKRQNEEIVNWLLEKYSDACVIPSGFPGTVTKADVVVESHKELEIIATEGIIPHSLYFIPKTSNTSGLFLTKIRKN